MVTPSETPDVASVTPAEARDRSAPGAAGAAPEAADGRTARSQRTREAVVDALLALISEGDPRPTARAIAERAGISLRSVYVHFDDLEDLFLAAAQRQMSTVGRFLVAVPATGPLADRVAAFCTQRACIYEEIAPIRRAAQLQEPFSPTLSRLLDFARRASRDELSRVFAAELDTFDRQVRRRRSAAVDALSSAEAWEVLRRTLSPAEAEQALTESILRVLTEPA